MALKLRGKYFLLILCIYAPGTTGQIGPKGQKGEIGSTGLNGAIGPQGIPGARGTPGVLGPTGGTGNYIAWLRGNKSKWCIS